MSWQSQYDLGVRYLSEGNYKEAIIAFTAAIEIDPKQERAYIGLVEAYVAVGDTEMASEVLKKAMQAIGETETLIAAGQKLVLDPTVRTERVDMGGGRYRIDEFETNGRIMRRTYYKNEMQLRTTVYERDEDGKLVRRVYYDAQGVMTGYSISEDYDNETHSTSYDATGIVTGYVVNKWDDDGKEHYYAEYDSDKRMTVDEKFEYNADGNVIRSTVTEYNADGSVEYYIIYEYGTEGEMLRGTEYNSDGSVRLVTTY